ncbi:MAG: hypothetical protein D6771_06730, partial [Zetaproteobacteria bacterium]
MDDETARALLDYRQYARVAAAMRARIRAHPNDAAAWRLLAEALRGLGRHDEARKAEARARALGGQGDVHLSLRLRAVSDSNVLQAPDVLALPARNRGDLGLGLGVAASGGAHPAWLVRYEGLRYQDFRALNRDALVLRIAPVEAASIYASWMRLGRARLFSGIGAELGWTPAERWKLGAVLERRVFAAPWQDFTAWIGALALARTLWDEDA